MRAVHGTPIYKQVSPELNTQLTAKLIETDLLRVGGTIAAITEQELVADTPSQLRAFPLFRDGLHRGLR